MDSDAEALLRWLLNGERPDPETWERLKVQLTPSQPPPTEPTYTRSQILEALTLEPCHVTGEHDPSHTPRYICRTQESYALGHLLDLIGVQKSELPRRMHAHCVWCDAESYPYGKDTTYIDNKAWADGAPLRPKA